MRSKFAGTLSLIGLAVSLVVPKLLWLLPLSIGLLVGTLFATFAPTASAIPPHKPLGRAWKIVWFGLVGLAIACFVAALRGWGTLEAGLVFTALAAWGVVLDRQPLQALPAL